jgi:hypothetical protein
MAERDPLTDDEIEAKLHDWLQQIVEAKQARGAVTPEGKEALRIAMTGPMAALMRMAKRQAGEDLPPVD